ncbi:17-beta-hydroxysteroid dehydrogenase 14 [Antennarius striatus]|uniref:17-beta-hydroxysteroid dehydrogenase 14 n=1 Tax=Antennarius striatus TaxID=241820 RepID=UPI0035B46F66
MGRPQSETFTAQLNGRRLDSSVTGGDKFESPSVQHQEAAQISGRHVDALPGQSCDRHRRIHGDWQRDRGSVCGEWCQSGFLCKTESVKCVFSPYLMICVYYSGGEELEASLNQTGPGFCKFLVLDVTKDEDLKTLVAVTVKQFGHIDCLINNAGWHPPLKSIDETTAEEFQSLLNLNLISCFLASKYALPHLRRRQGNIINVASLVASIGQKDSVTYVATKGAIVSMTKAMAVDESRYRVRVNCISPSNVMTPLMEECLEQHEDAANVKETTEKYQLIGRMATPAECGLVALFLAADGTFITGVDLLVAGGAELNYGVKSQIPSENPINTNHM